MKRMGKSERDGFFRERIPENHSKEIWTLFSHPENVSFFETLGDAFLKKYDDIEIAVIWRNPFYASISINPEQILMDRSDLFIIDTAFLFEEEFFLLENMASYLSRRLGSYFVFWSNKSHLNKFRTFINRRDEHGFFTPYELDNDRIFEFNRDMSSCDFDRLIISVDQAVRSIRGRRIFLCHAGEDWEFTRKLAHALTAKGIPVWYDGWSLKVGDSIVEKINQGIKDSSFMGVVLSKNAVDKPWCKREMNSALQRQLSDNGITILPILIEECEVPALLSDILWADFRESFDSGLSRLLESIRAV